MVNLDCTVTSCMFNKDKSCCKDNILVDGQNAKHSRDTSCQSFRERKADSVTSAVDYPAKNTAIACEAVGCTFNEKCKCHATHITVAGAAACSCQDTECSSFRCKCE